MTGAYSHGGAALVLAFAILKLQSIRQVGDWVVEQVGERIVAGLEGAGTLPRRIIHVIHGIADRTGKLAAPRVVVEGHESEQRKVLGFTGADGANVRCAVVKIVTDAFAVNQLKADGVAFDLIVSTQVQSPPDKLVVQVPTRLIFQFGITQNSCQLYMTPVLRPAVVCCKVR